MASPVVDRSTGESPIDRYKLLFRLQVLAAIGCLLIVLYSLRFWVSGDLLRIIGVGMLVAGAALAAGFLLGFIFGLPRVGSEKVTKTEVAKSGGAPGAVSEVQAYPVNSNNNLLEISDWLTKIMVGVGLVELNSIPGKLGRLSYYLGPGLRPTRCDGGVSCADLVSSGQAVGLAIIVFYSALGFLFGYIWTRLYFERDLGGLLADLQRDKRKNNLALLAEALSKEGKPDEAIESIDQALAISSQDGRIVLDKARILKRKAIEVEKPESEKLLNQALVYADQAIELLPGRAEPIYNKACYQALLGLSKSEVLGNLRSAFRLNPALRRIAAEDSDLKSLRQDPDFIQLIGINRAPNA